MLLYPSALALAPLPPGASVAAGPAGTLQQGAGAAAGPADPLQPGLPGPLQPAPPVPPPRPARVPTAAVAAVAPLVASGGAHLAGADSSARTALSSASASSCSLAPARASSAVRLFDAHCHLQGAPLFQAAAQVPPPLQGADRAAAATAAQGVGAAGAAGSLFLNRS